MADYLFDACGNRKYLTSDERQAFLAACELAPPDVKGLGMTLTYTGCRLSEALALTAGRLDTDAGFIVFETLKQRRKSVFRAVPVPPELLATLAAVAGSRDQLWPYSRTTAWRCIKSIMAEAGIAGPHATPKGLRHGFAVAAIQRQIPLNLVSKWLGHARLETTAIYADAIGEEERRIAERLW